MFKESAFIYYFRICFYNCFLLFHGCHTCFDSSSFLIKHFFVWHWSTESQFLLPTLMTNKREALNPSLFSCLQSVDTEDSSDAYRKHSDSPVAVTHLLICSWLMKNEKGSVCSYGIVFQREGDSTRVSESREPSPSVSFRLCCVAPAPPCPTPVKCRSNDHDPSSIHAS